MPTIGGVYQPLSKYQRQLAEQKLINIMVGKKESRKDVVGKIIAKIGVDESDRRSLNYHYQRARDAIDAAATMRRTHNRTPLASEIPNIRGDSRYQGKYRTELLVSILDVAGNVIGTTRANYYTDSPVSLLNIRRDINADPTAFIGNFQTPAGQRIAQQGSTVSVTTISAGRVNNA